MNKIKLICFDVDGTLVSGVSWLTLTEGMNCSIQNHLDIFTAARTGKISFSEAERQLVYMYRESGHATKGEIVKILSKVKLRPGVKQLILYLKKKNYPIYLISGSIDIFVKKVAEKMKVNNFYANSSLKFDNNKILSKIHYQHDQGKTKLKQLKKLIHKMNIAINEVAFIGDSWNDIEVFVATKHGIAVGSSDENLKKVAWKIVDSLKDIEKIL